MKEFFYTVQLQLYRSKYLKMLAIGWIIVLFVTVFQFLGVKSSAMLGPLTTSYFLFSADNLFYMIFIYTLPMISAMIYTDTVLAEKGLQAQLYMRGKRNRFHYSHMFNSFFMTFLFYVFMLLLTLGITYFMTNNDGNMIDGSIYLFNISNTQLLELVMPYYDVYVNNAFLFISIYIVLIAFYAGTCGVIAYTVSLLTNKKIIVYLTPFILTTLFQIGCNMLSSDLYIQNMVNPYASLTMDPCVYVLLYTVVCLVGCDLIYQIVKRKRGLLCR